MPPTLVKNAFKILLFLIVLLSFYIFIVTVFMKSTQYKGVFSTWQFPMLLAIFLDVYILEDL
jgi:uncharacterized integral membrane protein